MVAHLTQAGLTRNLSYPFDLADVAGPGILKSDAAAAKTNCDEINQGASVVHQKARIDPASGRGCVEPAW